MNKRLMPALVFALSTAAFAQDAAPAIPAGAQANVAVGDFLCKAAKCYSGLGGGIADALTTALLETGKFSVLERQNLNTLNEEAFAAGGANFEGADLVIFGSITAFEPEASSGGASFFGLSVAQKEATITADLRVVDVKTRRTIAGTRVEGKSTAQGVSVNIVGKFGSVQGGNVEKAVAAMLQQAVNQLMNRVPVSYYKMP